MKFVDSVKVHVSSGNGGAGCSSFRREKFIPNGGPDGGDGGKGGDIIFVGNSGKSSLLDLSFKQHQHAHNGGNGSGSQKHGRNGKDLFIHVPLGTLVKDFESKEVYLEVVENKNYLLFSGGRGGRGNARFKNSKNRAPEYHQLGEPGIACWIQLDLKIMADIGLVGFPNSGKSTFISCISKAKPKIADYPFTTLIPHLGVVETKNLDHFVIADIPGIIEGAHLGKGLGDRFLRHIERTKCLMIMLDVSGFSEKPPLEEYSILIKELKKYSPKLTKKFRVIVLTKIDSVTDFEAIKTFEKFLISNKETVFQISSLSRKGIPELIDYLELMVKKESFSNIKDPNRNLQIFSSNNPIWND